VERSSTAQERVRTRRTNNGGEQPGRLPEGVGKRRKRRAGRGQLHRGGGLEGRDSSSRPRVCYSIGRSQDEKGWQTLGIVLSREKEKRKRAATDAEDFVREGMIETGGGRRGGTGLVPVAIRKTRLSAEEKKGRKYDPNPRGLDGGKIKSQRGGNGGIGRKSKKEILTAGRVFTEKTTSAKRGYLVEKKLFLVEGRGGPGCWGKKENGGKTVMDRR